MKIFSTNMSGNLPYYGKDKLVGKCGFIWGRSDLVLAKRPDMVIYGQIKAVLGNKTLLVKIQHPLSLADDFYYIVYGGKFFDGVPNDQLICSGDVFGEIQEICDD